MPLLTSNLYAFKAWKRTNIRSFNLSEAVSYVLQPCSDSEISDLSDGDGENNDENNELYQPGHEEVTEENRLSDSLISS